jgi:hypothetical protein
MPKANSIIRLNLFANITSMTIKNIFFNVVVFIYEFLPVIIYASDLKMEGSSRNKSLFFYFNYLSQIHHLDFINSQFNTTDCSILYTYNNNNETQIFSQEEIISYMNPFLLYENNCTFSSYLKFLLYIIFVSCMLLYIYLAYSSPKLKNNNKYLSFFLKVIPINLINIFTKGLGIIIFEVFLMDIFIFFKNMNISQNGIGGNNATDIVYFFLSICFLTIFISSQLIQILSFSSYFEGYPLDPKMIEFEIISLIIKFLISLDMVMRKLHTFNKIILLNIGTCSLIIFSFYREVTHSEHITNLILNSFKQMMLFICCLSILFKYINYFFTILNENYPIIIIGELIFIVIINILYWVRKFKKGPSDFYFLKKSNYLLKNDVNYFLSQCLKYVFLHIVETEKQKKAVLGTNKILKINENIGILNSHSWHCEYMKSYENYVEIGRGIKENTPEVEIPNSPKSQSSKLLSMRRNSLKESEQCPICKIIKHYRDQRNSSKKLSDKYNEDFESNIILIAILKFTKIIEQMILKNDRFQKKVDLEIYFVLKFFLYEILDGRKCNRVLIFCSQFERNIFSRKTKLMTISLYLKDKLKHKYKENFVDYYNLKTEEICLNKFTTGIDLTTKFIGNLVEKNINFKSLTAESFKIGQNHNAIRDNLDLLSESIKMENKLTYVSFISAYKFIFNEVYDKYLASIYDINDNITLMENRFLSDCTIILDFDMAKSNLFIRKIPTHSLFSEIFKFQDIGKNFSSMFPYYLKKVESDLLVNKLTKNSNNNLIQFSTFIKDKANNLMRLNMKMKLLLNIESVFKLNCFLDPGKDDGLISIDQNGRIYSVSKEFTKRLHISSDLLSRFITGINIKNFIPDFKCHDVDNPQTFLINFSQYLKGFDNILSSLEEEYLRAEESNKVKSLEKAFIFKPILKKLEYNNEFITIYQIEERNVLNLYQNQNIHGTPNFFNKYISTQQDNINIHHDQPENSVYNIMEKNMEDFDLAFTDSSASIISRGKKPIKFITRDSNQFSEYMKNSRDLTKICYYIIIINLVIVIVGIIFLFIIKSKLDMINNSFLAYQSFKLASSRTYINAMGFLSLLTIKDENGIWSEDDFQVKKLKNDKNIVIDFPKFLNDDMQSKLNLLSSNIKEFHNAMYSILEPDFVKTQVNYNTNWFSFTTSSEIGYSISSNPFIETLDIFHNLIQTFAANEDIFYGFYVIDLSSNSTYVNDINHYFTHIADQGIEKNIVEVIINLYPSLDLNIQKIFINFSNYQNTLIVSLNDTIITCLVILISLEIVIIILTLLLTKIYKKQTILVMNLILSLHKDSLNPLLKKLKYVGKFLNLTKNPMKTLKKLKKLLKDDKKLKKTDYDSHKKHLRDREREREKEGKHEEINSMKVNSKYVNDEKFISAYFHKVSMLLLTAMISYFLFCYFQSNSTIANIQTDFQFMSYYFQDLQYSINIVTYIKTCFFLNKTNIQDDYFSQQINQDYFNTKSGDFYFRLQKLQMYRYMNYDSLYLFNDFLEEFKGDVICPKLIEINKLLLDKSMTTKADDLSQTLLYMCNQRPIMQTDLFSIFSYINTKVRLLIDKYMSNVKSVGNLKSLVDSEELYELMEIALLYIRPLYIYTHTTLVTPTFTNDLNTLFSLCIIIFVINIILNISFLLITKKFILDKIVRNVENLNILLKMLS